MTYRAAVALIVALVPVHSAAQPAAGALRWYKGNTHTHTLNSDGDSTPDEVVRWYREHDYQFLVLTDHNFLTSVDGLNALHGADEQFLVVKGEEVTESVGGKAYHINGLDVSRRVDPQGGATIVEILQRNVDAIRRENGIPHINHPNFAWSIGAGDLHKVRNNRLFEIFNGHPLVNNLGGGGVPGMEEVWDTILSNGMLLFGLAVDDAHYFKQPGNPDVPGPGRGWVVVRAAKLDARALMDALERGDFYASTGVTLAEYAASPQRVSLSIKVTGASKYRVQFIGKGGRVLKESTEPVASYDIRGDEGYVRAKVIESNGRIAWCQPVVVAPRTAPADRAGILLLVVVAATICAWRWIDVSGRMAAFNRLALPYPHRRLDRDRRETVIP